jgi:predicted RNA binding protein YcfA (HicA-like mRNA interferase family)
MTRLPRVTAQETIRVLERKGFTLPRQSVSHKIFKNSIGIRVNVPFHSGEILHPKLLKSNIEDAEISASDLES